MIRVGFRPFGTALWLAGVTYLENLFEALALADDAGLQRVLFVDPQEDPTRTMTLRERADAVIVESSPVDETNRNASIDVAFDIYGSHFAFGRDYPRIGWITDFQHLHLPEMSLPHLVQQRDDACRLTARHATRVVVSSHDALRDLAAIDPAACQRTDVLQFVARVPSEVYDEDPQWVVQRYHLPRKFIYLPNQCWKHKNHVTAIRALDHLRNRDIRPILVCTGNTVDHRDRLHFARMLEDVSVRGLRDQVIFLGVVPHRAVYALMRQSAFVLNPSRFEGWSTTVEEAKSLGKGLVLSDIAVHREQNPPAADFFPTTDSAALADVLSKRWQAATPGPDREHEAAARATLGDRMRAYGLRFAEIVRKTAATT